MKASKELWKLMPGNKHYIISNQGNVISLARGRNTGGLLKLKKNECARGGYMIVNLCIDGLCVPKMIHRMVAKAFLPNPSGKPFVNHKNGDRTDNRVENLEWVTAKENTRHAIKSGTFLLGSRRPQAKLDEKKVANIRMRYTGRYGEGAEFARQYKVSAQIISEVLRGLAWKHI